MSPTTKPLAVVPDANVLIGICAKEKDKHKTAETAIEDYLNKGYEIIFRQQTSQNRICI